MLVHNQYLAGWIDTSVHDFLTEVQPRTQGTRYALVTCLDSCFDVKDIAKKSPAFRSLGGNYRVVGKGILLSTRRLLSIESQDRLFFGFDEVWFCSRPHVPPKPKNLVITGPYKITAAALGPLAEWMRRSGCTLGIGDGTGMNYCARVQGVSRLLLEAFSTSVESEVEQKTRVGA